MQWRDWFYLYIKKWVSLNGKVRCCFVIIVVVVAAVVSNGKEPWTPQRKI